jgi:dolichyl-phosphate-mannose--protein O-mannosyl transferase
MQINYKKLAIVCAFFAFLFVCFLFRINYFNSFILDEGYYGESAQRLYQGKSDDNYQHPILAKWLISLPMYGLGDSWSLGWRAAPLAAGFGGLVVLYFYSRYSKIEFSQRLVIILALVGSGAWYVLSRIAMLDIFISFFALVSIFFLYVFLNKNDFSADLSKYKYWRYLVWYSVFVGVAAACKWSGFFSLFFVLGFVLYYLNGSFWRRAGILCLTVLGSVAVFAAINIALLNLNVNSFFDRTFRSAVFHNTEMLPEEVRKRPAEEAAHADIGGAGFGGLMNFLIYQHVYVIDVPEYKLGFSKIALSHNQFLPVSFIALSVIFLLSALAVLIRKIQKIVVDEDEVPLFMKDRVLLFNYLIACAFMLPWIFIARIQYSFYYLPAFPFLLIAAFRYIFSLKNVYLKYILIGAYFSMTAYWLRWWIPV